MSLRLTQFLERSLSHTPIFVGVGGLLYALSLGCTASWAIDGHNVTQVSPPSRGAGPTQSGSSAAGPAPARRPTPNQTSIPQDTSTNEQARIYQRANENLITQTVYLEQNIAEVKDLRDKLNDPATYGDPANELSNVKKITSNFCDNPAGSDYTDTIRCMDQFREIRAQELRDLRVSLVNNDDALARLRGELSASKKGSGSSNRAPVYQKSFKAQVFPKIPTFQDLSANEFPDVIKQGYLPQMNHEAALKFATRLMSKPDCNQFVETTDALVDPEDPGAGTFHQIVRDEKGNPKINTKACQQAWDVFDKMAKLRADPATGKVNKSNDAEPLAKQIMAAHQKLLGDPKAGKPARKTLSEAVGSTADQKPQKCDDLDAGPRRDYCYARNYVVMFFNGEAVTQQKKGKKDKGAQLQATGAQRIPSVLKQVKGYDSESHLLNAERSPADDSKGGKEEVENLYMDPTYIDGVINSQYPSSGP